MNKINGCTWTTVDETHDIYEKLAKLHGDDIDTPTCQHLNKAGHECGATTTYIVIDGKEINDKYRLMISIMPNMPYYQMDGKVYFPIMICLDCGAAKDGFEEGLNMPNTGLQTMLFELPKMTLTPEDQKRYRTVFERAFMAGALHKSAASCGNDLSRYIPKGAK